jgi:lipopolysaccharide/colanic/teichoic acid biosynthesis glycosyltransferase
MKNGRIRRGRILVYGTEILLLFASYGAAYWLRFVSFEKFGQRLPAGVFVLMAAVYPAAFYLAGLYLRPGRPWSSELYWRLAFAVGGAAVALGFLKYAFFLEPIGRGLLFLASFIFFLLSYSWRSVGYRMLGGGAGGEGGEGGAGAKAEGEAEAGRIPVDLIPGEDWFWRTAGFQLSERETFVRAKRAVDFGLAVIFVAVTLPGWGLIGLLIKATSRGSVFYRQTRVGRNGKVFRLVKFRSMIERAEESEPVWAEENDKRVTRVGRLLRKLHADELPQLLNVLRGEMSLVGPRPERPEFVEMLEREIPYYGLRHLVMPGLTGWAQINHPYAASLEDSKVKLEYDLYYIAHMSLGFDLRILLRTVQAPSPPRQ